MVDAHFRAHQQKSVVFKFLPIERKSIRKAECITGLAPVRSAKALQ
jgi:hypothetical protein